VEANWLHLFDVIVRSDNTFSAMRERPSATCNSVFSGNKPRKQVFIIGKKWRALRQIKKNHKQRVIRESQKSEQG
jgi:hypothetical protein